MPFYLPWTAVDPMASAGVRAVPLGPPRHRGARRSGSSTSASGGTGCCRRPGRRHRALPGDPHRGDRLLAGAGAPGRGDRHRHAAGHVRLPLRPPRLRGDHLRGPSPTTPPRSRSAARWATARTAYDGSSGVRVSWRRNLGPCCTPGDLVRGEHPLDGGCGPVRRSRLHGRADRGPDSELVVEARSSGRISDRVLRGRTLSPGRRSAHRVT